MCLHWSTHRKINAVSYFHFRVRFIWFFPCQRTESVRVYIIKFDSRASVWATGGFSLARQHGRNRVIISWKTTRRYTKKKMVSLSQSHHTWCRRSQTGVKFHFRREMSSQQWRPRLHTRARESKKNIECMWLLMECWKPCAMLFHHKSSGEYWDWGSVEIMSYATSAPYFNKLHWSNLFLTLYSNQATS